MSKRKRMILEAKETFKNNTEDVFPYVESAIDILDENLNWWKQNWEDLEDDIKDALAEVGDKDATINVRFIVFNGEDETTSDVIWHGPAIEYEFSSDDETVKQIAEILGDTWNGHKILKQDNRLIILFE